VAVHHLKEYIRPADLEEALATVRRHGDAARPIGGGIDLVRHTPPAVTTLVDLTSLPLSYIRAADDGIHIGATTTLGEIEGDPLLGDYAGGVVPDMLHGVGSMQLRNLATLGGALVGAHPWSDVVPVGLALAATVSVYDGVSHELPLAELLGSREPHPPLVTAIHLPTDGGSLWAAFVKFAATGFDVATLNVCVALRWKEGSCAAPCVVIGGTPWLATAVPAAAAELAGRPLVKDTIASAAAAAARQARVGDDRRATATYRRTLVEVGVRRALERIAAMTTGGRS